MKTAIDWNKYLAYNPDTGILTWRHRNESEFSRRADYLCWNKKFADKEAGSRCRNNRIYVQFMGNSYLSYRVIWEMVHGSMPANMQIDHINNVPWDNRLVNLRMVTQSQNQWNRGANGGRPDEMKGIVHEKNSDTWVVQIKVNGKRIHIGRFSDLGAAKSARAMASNTMHGEYSNINRP